MTKVNITVTKELEEVPKELEKHFSTMCDKVKELLRGLRTLERSISLGFPSSSMTQSIVEMSKELGTLKDMFQDAYNISDSYGKIEDEKEAKIREEEIVRQVEEYKSKIQQQVAEIKNSERLLQNQIAKLTEENKTMSSLLSNTNRAKETAPKKKTTKAKTVRKK